MTAQVHATLAPEIMIRILALAGSLRRNSSSNKILETIISLAPADVAIETFNGLGELPHFNDPPEDPVPVKAFKEKIREADVILICTPEYAFGIPGSLKNAIDWTVGTGDFVDKPVALVTASSQGEKGHAALLLVLTAVSAKVVESCSMVISSVRSRFDPEGKVKDSALLDQLRELTRGLPDITKPKINIL